MRGYRKLVALLFIFTAMGLARPCASLGQSDAFGEETNIHFGNATQRTACGEPLADQPAKAALRLVCLRERLGAENSTLRNAIVIGFVGGFVRNGHSWGASQAVTLARDLGRLGIPVSLTIQVDSVHKPGHDDAVIPPNVRNAVNFYQTRGLIHGRSRIRASDPERTNIIGNFRMSYQNRQVDCDNYPWLARHLNKPHHEIENDPLVWEQIASMIDSELFKGTSMVEASLPSTSLVVKQDQR